MSDIVDRLRSAETAPLDADGKVALFLVLQDARAEIERLRKERRGWLTAREREEVQWAADAAYDKQHPAEDTLRALLARSTPPKVQVPDLDDLEPEERPVWESACREWIAAIRAAGGEVEG